MKFPEKRFSVPFCVFSEPMPSKALKLLLFLLSRSDFSGFSQPGYSEMVKAIRDDPAENGCHNTVRTYLKLLEQKAWIFHMRRTNGKMGIWLQIPPRFRHRKSKSQSLISEVSL